MHRDFADWYRAASLGLKADDLGKRWQAIEDFAKDSTASDIAELSRLFHGQPSRVATFAETFRTRFKQADGAFAMEDNDLEVRILAGAALVRHLDYGNKWAAAAALCLVVPACFGLRPPPVGAIVETATKDIVRQSEFLRRNGVKSLPKLDLTTEIQAVKTQLQGNQVPTLAESLTGVLKQLVATAVEFANWTKQAEEEQSLRREESDVLWWLAGAHSRDLKVPLGELKCPSGCLVVAKELADLTGLLPGPYAVESFLDNALNLAQSNLKAAVAIADAVTACDPEWRKKFATADGLDAVLDLCPVHIAARKCDESHGKKTWHTPFHASAGFKATAKVKPLDLSLQAYRERLLIRALSELGANSDA